MDQITAPQLASMILSAPAWMRLGIAVRDEQMRQRAAEQLAEMILGERTENNRDQLALSL